MLDAFDVDLDGPEEGWHGYCQALTTVATTWEPGEWCENGRRETSEFCAEHDYPGPADV